MEVVIIGGGVAGLEGLLALRDLAGARVRITLVSGDPDFVYRPLSVGEPFALGDARRVSLEKVAAEFGAELRQANLQAVVPQEDTLLLDDGETLGYDAALIAVGARRVPAFDHAITFRGSEDSEAVHGLIQDIEGGYSRRVAFIVPTGVSWSLPLYELALMAARRAREMGIDDMEIGLITPEEAPLAIFGPRAGGDVAAMLEAAGITVHAGCSAEVAAHGKVVVRPGGHAIECQRIVALPVVEGPSIQGLPSDADGFIPTDAYGAVVGLERVFAAGDGTAFPVKQGGLACQQADAAAESIAQLAGANVDPSPFRPVLRGQLMTGGRSHFMRTHLSGSGEDEADSAGRVLWWPPTKVAGRYLAPYLAPDGSPAEARTSGGARRRAFIGAGRVEEHELHGVAHLR